MDRRLPGTTLTCPAGQESRAFGVLEPIFSVSGGGLSLSQVSELTGLTPSTVQNWVKRGWVESPVNKKYDEIRVARILLINLLRSSMQLEQITRLLAYVNGRVDDRTDDSMPDTRLYSLTCAAIFRLQDGEHPTRAVLRPLIEAQLSGYAGGVPDAPERLLNTLEILLLNVEASMRMKEAEERYRRLMNEEGSL